MSADLSPEDAARALPMAAYFGRLGLDRVAPTCRGIATLQAAQIAAIPFEGIDPFLGIVPSLELAAIADKTLARGRGGYCFELNALIGAALAAAGVPARQVLARVRLGGVTDGPRSHVAWIAEAEGRSLLVDAGFGGPGPRLPLALDTPGPQACGNGTYRLRPEAGTGERLVERQGPDGWEPLYAFDMARVTRGDIAAANHVCATWGHSSFTRNLMVSGQDGATRVALRNRAATFEGPKGIVRREVADADALHALLAGRLGLAIDAETCARLWARLP